MSKININNLTFCHKGSYINLFDGVCLQLDTEWKLGLVGRNGKGKTTLFNILLGNLQYFGEINCTVDFEYFPYQISDKNKTVYDILEEINPQFEEWKVRKELNLLDVIDCDFYRSFLSYSSGEQTKILLSAMFAKDNTFLLIDEPTNHLDMKGRELIAKYLDKKSGYIIISHDKNFIDGCVDHILSINRNNIVLQKGNLSGYLENINKQTQHEQSENDKLNADIKRLKKASLQTSEWADMRKKVSLRAKIIKADLDPIEGL